MKIFNTLKNYEFNYPRLSIFFLSLFVISSLLLKFHLLFQLPINQDEFSFLSQIYKYMDGTLNQPLNSFHVHFFQWLADLGSNEVNQVIGARIVMYLLFLGSCFYLYLIGKYYVDTAGALFALLCYISLIPTVVNGASFRHDSIATFPFLFALYYFLVKEKSLVFNVLSGIAMAIAVTVTIKSVIYMGVFSGLMIIRLISIRDHHKTIVPLIGFFLTFLLGAIMINQLHIATLASTTIAPHTQTISRAYSTFVSFTQFFPQFTIFKFLLRLDVVIWLFLASGIIFNIIDCFKKNNSIVNISLFALLIPLFSIFFYRNAFPYFYVFIMPTTTIFCGYMLWHLTGPIKKYQVICFTMIVILAGAVYTKSIAYYSIFSSKSSKIQHQILDTIHKMFPNPVPYIDGCFMVSSYPDVGFFMSSAGMEGYLKNKKPIMEALLNDKRPLFLLANVPQLNLHADNAAESDTHLRFKADDWQALKSNFIHHWGPIWVLGKHFEFKGKFESNTFQITVPGVYTVEGNGKVMIDGHLISAGNTVKLDIGDHCIRNQETPGLINLKWGDHLYQPEEEPAPGQIFLGPFI